jgi:ParB family chromosome partitioning protein
VVIGHRRLAAAKAAGFGEVPVVVSLMDRAGQVRTMAQENLCRSGLTVTEQARCFQLMFDLGDSMNDISEKTGFSKTTVRHRLEIARLPEGKVKASVEAGATIFDLIELEQVEDIALREKLLESAGTTNFIWKVKEAVKDERASRNMGPALAEAGKFAVPFPDGSHSWRHVLHASYDLSEKEAPEINRPEGPGPFYYRISGHCLIINGGEEKEEAEPLSDEEAARRQDYHTRLEGLWGLDMKFHARRLAFIGELKGKKLESLAGSIISAAIFLLKNEAASFDFEALEEASGRKGPLHGLKEYSEGTPHDKMGLSAWLRLLLETLYACTGHSVYQPYGNISWKHEIRPPGQEPEPDEALPYAVLGFLGYELDDEERQWLDGTHGLYAPAPSEDGGEGQDSEGGCDDSD